VADAIPAVVAIGVGAKPLLIMYLPFGRD
jgi:hypothetical protein